MQEFALMFPPDFADYEWEVTVKGHFSQAKLVVDGRSYSLSFFDPARLAQEIQDELSRGEIFLEPNLVVISSLTRVEIERAVELLMTRGCVERLLPD
ncbi:hypothetical protein [Bradyrhizobium sp. USDA 4353]